MSITSFAKAVWRREPAILAGLVATATFFFSTRYGANGKVSGSVQGLGSTAVFLVFTTLRGLVTSPAGRDLLTRAQNNLPGFVSDVSELVNVLGPIRKARGGPGGYIKALEDMVAKHRGQLESDVQDAIARVHGVIRGSTAPAPALVETPTLPTVGNTPPVATLAAPVPSGDPVPALSPGIDAAAADLGQLLGVTAAPTPTPGT